MTATETDPVAPAADSAPEPGRKPGLRAKLAAGLVTVVLLLGGGFALTQVGDSTSSSASSSAQGGPGGGMGGTAPASGTISAVSATSITVKTSSGTTKYTVASSTTVQNNGATSTAAKLTVGEKVVVFTGSAGGSAPGATSGTTTGTSTGTSSTTASRILAGTSATQAGGSGMGGGTPPTAAA